MEKGSYNGRRVDFGSFTASRFNPHLFVGPFDAQFGCGATALALLTGIAPKVIAAENGSAHFPDQFMVRFLRWYGYKVQPLTLCNLSTSDCQIGCYHVVLLCQLFRRNEATWGVVFNGAYFHNFDIYKLDTLSLLNKPVLSAYLVIHPSLRLPRPFTPRFAAPKLKTKRKRFRFAALGLRESP